ncbi:GTPase Era [Afipia felis]
MIEAAEQNLSEIVSQIVGTVGEPTPNQQRALGQLRDMAGRLNQTTFQLAVLGQFKRGKSTLLNALLGCPLLSAGVLPLTAVPTFLFNNSKPLLRLQHLTGAAEECTFPDLGEMAEAIADTTTEERNPNNEKGLARVDAGLPFSTWLGDVVLVDTPGIGSTYSHNTDAANAVLSECDAALFVLSVDPPITEVEVDYLARISRTVSRIIVVLNKIDLFDQRDQDKAIAFLSSVIARQGTPKIDEKIFPVSARQALAARQQGAGDCDNSGVPALEDYIRQTLVAHKRIYLERSVAGKAAEALAVLQADAALMERALTMPLAELDQKIGIFETAAADFIRERETLQDLLSGDWRRANARLDALCEKAEERARRQLESAVVEVNNLSQQDMGERIIEQAMNVVFDKEFAGIVSAIDDDIAAAMSEHQGRYRTLAKRVQEAAAALMDVPVPPGFADNWLQIKREPYWIGKLQIESLSSITVDNLIRLLPAQFQRRRWLKQLRLAVDRAVTRNISDLHWTMRQNIDDSFRGLLAASKDAVDASLDATRDALRIARDRRQATDHSFQAEVAQIHKTRQSLAVLGQKLDRYQHDQIGVPSNDRLVS